MNNSTVVTYHPVASVYHDETHYNTVHTAISQAYTQLHATKPLALSLTNTVTINFVANAQLAVGAVAAMVTSAQEVRDLCDAGAQGMYMNLGTLAREYAIEYPAAAQYAYHHHIPWVLDPVGTGAGVVRSQIVRALRDTPPTIIRCNASEALTLARVWDLPIQPLTIDSADTVVSAVHGTTTDDGIVTDGSATAGGVESYDDVDDALGAARALAQHCHGAIAISGEIDAIVDEQHVYRLSGGSALMSKVTGAGCSLGGVTASYACISDPTIAALTASAHYNIAAERAASSAHGPGSFAVAFLDELYAVSVDDFKHIHLTIQQ